MSWQYTKNEYDPPVAYLVAQDETILLRLRNCSPGQQDLGGAHSFSRDILRRSRGNWNHTVLPKSRNRSDISDNFSPSPYLPKIFQDPTEEYSNPKGLKYVLDNPFSSCFHPTLSFYFSLSHNFLPVHLRNDNVCKELNI